MPIIKLFRRIKEALSGKNKQPAEKPQTKTHRPKSKAEKQQHTKKNCISEHKTRPSQPDSKESSRRKKYEPDRHKPTGKSPKDKNRSSPHTASPVKANFKPWNPETFNVPAVEGKLRFHDLNLPEEIMRAVHDLGFQYCTPIQAQALAQTIAGANVAGKAQTGTGKTAAFLIAIIKRILDNKDLRPRIPGRPIALILAPTRELVIQIIKDADALGKYSRIKALAVYGGMDHEAQQKNLSASPVDIIAATPGRLIDFMSSRTINLSDVKTLVIDEADRMLDMGFIPDVSRIVRRLPSGDNRQTLLFSATLTEEVMRLAGKWMPDPVAVSVDPEHATIDTISQIVYPISSKEKFTILYNIIKNNQNKRILIFRNRKRESEHLAHKLCSYGISVELLSGDVDQKKRIHILESFREGKANIVVATDVAGRGIHVDDIHLVVNYDFPYKADDYIHRIGRTGRAGNVGTAISFACEDESFIIPEIEELLKEELKFEQPDEILLAPIPESAYTAENKSYTSKNRSAHGRRPQRHRQKNFAKKQVK